MRFPTIKQVAAYLISLKSDIEDDFREEPDDEPGFEVRLQVYPDGSWAVHTGDPQYDQDHRGYWGSGYLTRRSDCRGLARDLIDEAKSAHAESR